MLGETRSLSENICFLQFLLIVYSLSQMSEINPWELGLAGNESDRDHRVLCSGLPINTWLLGQSGGLNALFPLDFFHKAPHFLVGPKQ